MSVGRSRPSPSLCVSVTGVKNRGWQCLGAGLMVAWCM